MFPRDLQVRVSPQITLSAGTEIVTYIYPVIGSLKGTVNKSSDSGDASRHAHLDSKKPKKSPILITEARAIVATLVHQWIRSKGF